MPFPCALCLKIFDFIKKIIKNISFISNLFLKLWDRISRENSTYFNCVTSKAVANKISTNAICSFLATST